MTLPAAVTSENPASRASASSMTSPGPSPSSAPPPAAPAHPKSPMLPTTIPSPSQFRIMTSVWVSPIVPAPRPRPLGANGGAENAVARPAHSSRRVVYGFGEA